MQIAHFRRECGLVTNGAGRATQQGGNFRTGLRESENVINEKQHVLILFVAEIFGDGQSRKGDAQARARWLIHLAIDERDFGFAEIFLFDDIGLGHFVVQVVAFARPLADAGEH